ncbi:MAG TPA: 50S ribosomal protein L25 [Actinomycetota bacterium]|nr:50S ribosomal protein L25 [Actinomycetota bacterium]
MEKLVAQPREDKGKGAARRLRAKGMVPAVVYGHGADPLHLTVDARELLHLLHTEAGTNVLVDLRVDSEQLLAIPREIQRDHIKGQFIHIDFLRVARDEKITVEVPVHLTGESHGVKEGGVVEHHLWTLQVECLPQDVPTSIEADISELGINESLKVEALPGGDKFTILTSPEEVVVSVVPPQVLKVEEEVVEAVEGEAVEGEAAEGEAAEASPVEEPQPEG